MLQETHFFFWPHLYAPAPTKPIDTGPTYPCWEKEEEEGGAEHLGAWLHYEDTSAGALRLSPWHVNVEEPNPQLGPCVWSLAASSWQGNPLSWARIVKIANGLPWRCGLWTVSGRINTWQAALSTSPSRGYPLIGECFSSGMPALRPRSTRDQQYYRRDEATVRRGNLPPFFSCV
jgi:hypothetical protein